MRVVTRAARLLGVHQGVEAYDSPAQSVNSPCLCLDIAGRCRSIQRSQRSSVRSQPPAWAPIGEAQEVIRRC
jgi:hypothetical protein